ncbi:hypothetical protein BXU06_07820 [Aquaspirillum sp. LM1]|uniref:hypothetical protein n=1 Tax=Aquaspirillum sp. LM1 TaxID=1938604 RepID=UPI000983C6FF|nr:hypothetical protein [Aquaspirillum sp. LM1]AQR64982.1 hypothetical protein BXU06_07820 [Aquaspirillum sp. LM1]
MSEFNNRIEAQRNILKLVNKLPWQEDLCGLSKGAIERWVKVNNIDEKGKLFVLVKKSAEKLFFLANKSQEQVTEEYSILSTEISLLTKEVSDIVNHIRKN